MASAFVDVPPISPSAVSMTGSRMPRLAASYFGLCTNQAPSTLTPCISKTCWVSIRPPATPGVLLLIHWVICVQLREEQCTPPQQSESENCPLHSLVPGGCPFVVAFWGYLSYFPIFWPLIVLWRCCWLWKNNLSVCLFFPLLLYCDVCAAAATEQKRFSINKHQDGEFLGNLTRTSLNI